MLIQIILSSITIIIVGCILHFLYAWSNEKKFVAFFSAVNESVWEHIKIGLTPTFLFMIFVACFGSTANGFFRAFVVASAACLGIIVFVMPFLYYLKEAIIKKFILTIDIAIFCVTIMLSQAAFIAIFADYDENFNTICHTGFPDWLVILCLAFVVFIFSSYCFFTAYPPKFFIFRDPRNGKYGLSAYEKEKKKQKS